MEENKKYCGENYVGMCEKSVSCCKMRVKRHLAFFLAIASIFLIMKTVNEYREGKFIGQDIVPQNTIVVSGTGKTSAPADIAEFSFSVTEEAKTVKEAQNMAAKKNNQALELLKKNDIEDKDIKTAGYNVYPKYEQQYREVACNSFGCPPFNSVLVGYEVSQTISVKVRDLDRVGEIMGGIGNVGVSNISGLSFSIDKEDDLRRESRQKAIKEAKEKAEQLAKDLDVDLVRIINFSEGVGYPAVYGRGVMEAVTMSVKDAIVPEIPMGENDIISNVSITYEIK